MSRNGVASIHKQLLLQADGAASKSSIAKTKQLPGVLIINKDGT